PLREQEGMCYTCHDADGPAASDIQSAFAAAYHHDVSAVDQASGSHVECIDCHNPHTASAASPLANPDAGGATQWTGTGEAFCLTCHDGTAPPGVAFPATASGSGYDKSTFVGSRHAVQLGSDSCRQCHNAHGSQYRSMLGARYVTADYNPYTPGDGDYGACWTCHSENAIVQGNNAFGNLHKEHVDKKKAPCIVCHDAHAPFDAGEQGLISLDFAVRNGYDISFIDGRDGSTAFWIDAGQNVGNCFLRCHGEQHQPKSYNRP
ncbi:MAG: cytochrome c3 family protein, partial [Phycisphaerae bacterium]